MRRAKLLASVAALLLLVMGGPATVLAQDLGTVGTASPAPAVREMQVAGDAVNIRSGPGMYFYTVAKLNKGTRVPVFGTEGQWTATRPPASVVALVKKSDIAMGDGTSGAVDAAAARVYAKDPASDRTWAVIDRLARDALVTVIREEAPYLVIAMPETARVYVRNDYLERVQDTGSNTTTPVGPYELPKVKEFKLDPQSEAYDAATKLLSAEMEKPLMERDFDAAEKALGEVLEKAEANYLKTEVQGCLETIKFQRDLQAGMKKLEADRKALADDLAVIKAKEDAEQGRLTVSPTDAMKLHAFEGVVMPMRAQMAYRYRLQDDDRRLVCLLDGEASLFEPLVGKKVRVWGEKQYLPAWKTHVCEVTRIAEVAAGE